MLQALPQSQPDGPRKNRKRTVRRRFRLAAALLAALGVGAYVLLHSITAPVPEGCVIRANGERLDLDLEQAANASTIAAVAASRGLPERAVTIALATAMQESALENIGHGDRDSIGLFQQRPSQGWGTAAQIGDPVYATNGFFDALLKVPGYSRLPLTVAAQKVQKSGYPQAYAKHETDASLIAAAMTGRKATALRCTVDRDGGSPPGDARVVRDRVAREFGQRLGVATREGRVLRFPVAGGQEPDGGRKGWTLALWATAHADELGIERVTYQARQWTAPDSADGWREDGDAKPPGSSAGGVRVTLAK